MDWYQEGTTVLDLLGAVGGAATAITLIFAAWTVAQNSRARNLAVVVAISQQLVDQHRRGYDAGLYHMSDADFHAYQMLHLLEHTCFLVNKRHVTGASRSFVREWLENEVSSIMRQPFYQAQLAQTEGAECIEIKKMIAKLQKRAAEDAHWDKVLGPLKH